jgi:hypothetical protein
MYKFSLIPWAIYLYGKAVEGMGLYDYYVVCLLATFLGCGAFLGMSTMMYLQDRRDSCAQ